MVTIAHLNSLAETMAANGVTLLEVEGSGYSLRLARDPARPHDGPGGPGPDRERAPAVSPAAGRICPRGGDDGFAPLRPGASVAEGEVLAYIGIGPVRIPCLSPAKGRLLGRPPVEGDPVAVGDLLCIMEILP